MEQTPLPTSRAKEIAGDGPYKADGCVVDGHTLYGIVCESDEKANDLAFSLNAAYTNGYKQGQQDRWISVEERLPEPNIEVLVAFEGDTIPGCAQWTRVRMSAMGWLGPAENDHKTVTHWMPLPPNPEQR